MIPTYHKGQRCYGTGYDMMSRIEQLEERLKAATDDAKEAETYAEELEAKLTKAVGALDKIKRTDNLVGVFAACERTLAELTGGKDE